MTLALPLSVRLRTSSADQHITNDVKDLQFRSVIPGGFASCTVSLHRPLILQPDEIAYYADLIVYDARNANVVWEGRLEDPGRSASSDGEVWELTAVGPAAHASDRTVPLIYVDTSYEGFIPSPPKSKHLDVGEETRASDGEPHYMMKFHAGSTVTTGAHGGASYTPILDAGMHIARVSLDYDMGATTANWEFEAVVRDGMVSGAQTIIDVPWTTTQTNTGKRLGTDWTGSYNVLELRIRRVGADTVVDDNAWVEIDNFVIRGKIYNKDGTELTSNYLANSIKASTVVGDLMGRLLTEFDGANASIETTTHNIDQLSYPDGVTPAEVLEDLMLLEPAYYWRAGASNSAGLYSFTWRSWPTSVRYEADVSDGFNSPGSADGLYNAVSVRWTNRRGRIRRTRRTQTVPELDAAGLTREAFIDLGDELASSANAIQAGDQFLAEHKTAPNRGTLTVAQRILDRDTGRMVEPWEIQPGYLIRVRDVLPRVNSLNATARDGVTVFKIVSSEFDASAASATLELDSHSPTVARAIAKLSKNRITRRR